MAGTTVRGIPAKFEGTCPICNGVVNPGDLIDKISPDDQRRGHVQCVANARSGRPAQSLAHPGGAQYQQPPQGGYAPPPAQGYTPPAAPVGPHARANAALGEIDVFKSEIPRLLWEAFEGLGLIARGATMAGFAVEKIARIVDPHEAQRHQRGGQ